ncbi:MAG: vitamin K epoxide reductase family protein [Bacteroidales bacterium]|nr:vitamin K epoxide reductase family protein [Bacteroidales bacterium]
MAEKRHSLINDYLHCLGVPHTFDYSEKRVRNIPFKTMFGFSKLLEEYGIESEAYLLEDKTEIQKLTPPFLANTAAGEVIVTEVSPSEISYLTEGVAEKVASERFMEAWDGRVLLSFPSPDACEPDYATHARIEFFMRAKKWVLGFCAVYLFLYLFIKNGIYEHISTTLIAAIDLGGLYFTYLLVQKSVKIHNPAADRVCGVLQAGGCDSILETKASKFFGIFGWSEVGFAYFSVSLAALMLLPQMLPWLALCNLCCLPFTFWSIWYQRFKAHKWCTLCVCVQGSLWLIFFNYLFGGWLKLAWPISANFFALGIAYLGVMLALNAIMPLIEKSSNDTSNENS